MNLRGAVFLIGLTITVTRVEATPRSWMEPLISVEGEAVQGRFGDEVACSSPAVGLLNRSLVAVAAPSANAGRGAIYLYDPTSTSSPLQTLEPTAGLAAARFGLATEFIDDVNGDGIDDLVVGAPGVSGQIGGALYAFLSTHEGDTLQYSMCGRLNGAHGFAERIQAIRVAGGLSDVNFVVGVPSESRIVGYSLSISDDGLCTFSEGRSFVVAGADDTRFGDAFGQIQGALSGVNNSATLAVVAPRHAEPGSIFIVSALPDEAPLSPVAQTVDAGVSTLPGSSVGARFNSLIFAVGIPSEMSGRGLVSIYSAASPADPPLCSKFGASSNSSQVFGSVISHLGRALGGVFGEQQAVFAVRQVEEPTGGALALFGASQGSCTDVFELNNCERDPLQEQGRSVVGGDDCQTEYLGQSRQFIVVGSPGWSGGRGRIDLYLEGSQHEDVLECASSPVVLLGNPTSIAEVSVTGIPIQTPTIEVASTPVVTPTATTVSDAPTPLPTPMPSQSSAPIVIVSTPQADDLQTPISGSTTPTPEGSPTHDSPVDPTPADTATPTPTAQETVVDEEPVPSTPHSRPTDTGTKPTQDDNDQGAISAGTPIPIFPGAEGLPTPEVIQAGEQVVVTMPQVTPQLSASARQRAIKSVMKRGRVSRKRAQTILADSSNLMVMYIVSYTEVTAQARFSFIQSAHADEGGKKRATKTRRIRSRNNQVTLARLNPGATYRVSYQVEISVKKPRSVVGVTTASAPTTFLYRGG